MSTRQRALLLVNPGARRPAAGARLDEGIRWLRGQGWHVEIQISEHPGHLTDLARQAVAQGFDCVIACGGDGTLNEVANGLVGSSVALAHVPAGTMNVWAREAGLPRDPVGALRLVAEGARIRVDTGLVGGRSFLLMASVGLDSAVVAGAGPSPRRHPGPYAYLGRALLRLLRFRGLHARIAIDGSRIETPMVGLITGNTRLYGGLLQITRHARADDGLLDVCIYQGFGRRRFLGALFQTLRSNHDRAPSVLYRKATRIDLDTDPPWPVQADGEFVGCTPVTMSVVPHSLTVVVPRGRQSRLWGPAGKDSSLRV